MITNSFQEKLLRRAAVAVVCTAVLAMLGIVPAISHYFNVTRGLVDVERYRMLLDLATDIAAERGPANIVMSEGANQHPAAVAKLKAYRDRINEKISGLAGETNESAIPAAVIKSSADSLSHARKMVDIVAATPRDRLRLEDFQAAIEAMFNASDRMRDVVAWEAGRMIVRNPDLAGSASMGLMVFDLRDYGGRIASQIIAPVALQRPIPDENLVANRRSEGRLLELWRLIKDQNALYDAPDLVAGRQQIEKQFFGDGRALVDRVLAEGRNGSNYSIDVTKLTERFVPTMQAIENYRRAYLDVITEKARKTRIEAVAVLATASVTMSVILLVLAVIVVSIRRQIFRPLLLAHDGVIRLANDQPADTATQPIKSGEIRALFSAIEILQQKLQERAMLTRELQVQAETDGLTALFNRRTLQRIACTIPVEIEDSACLVLMDIDRFKAVNDTHGHPTGDAVLIRTAQLLRSLLRAGDITARFGGEEFAILIPGRDLYGAVLLADKIRSALELESFHSSSGTLFHVTASFGVACGKRGERGWPQLVQWADAALYKAKTDGRNCVREAAAVQAPDEPAIKRSA